MQIPVGHEEIEQVFRVLDLTGVLANAVLGGVIARQEKLDPIGFVTLAVLSGLGGGLIRDVLLQNGPPAALKDIAYLSVALVGALVSYLVPIEGRVWHHVWPVVDAIALGTWATAGSQKTLAVGLGWVAAILLGTITAVGGGAVRDIVLRRVPGVLGGNTLYATCAIAASAVLVGGTALGEPTLASGVAVVVGAGLCLVARRRGWILPSADAWSPARVVSTGYLQRIRRRTRRGRDGDDPANGPDS